MEPVLTFFYHSGLHFLRTATSAWTDYLIWSECSWTLTSGRYYRLAFFFLWGILSSYCILQWGNMTSSHVLFNLKNQLRLVSSLYKSPRCSTSCTDGQLITGKIWLLPSVFFLLDVMVASHLWLLSSIVKSLWTRVSAKCHWCKCSVYLLVLSFAFILYLDASYSSFRIVQCNQMTLNWAAAKVKSVQLFCRTALYFVAVALLKSPALLGGILRETSFS